MKAAFWGVAIIVLGVLGIVLINLFGNITVTNQLNYTTMKNAVEASMNDALDIAHYRSGFCLCTNKDKSSNGKWVFTDDTEYELIDITHILDTNKEDRETCVSMMKNCEVLHGEYRLNKRVFAESLTRRFAEMVDNDKDYKIIIQDIIEYPPKVSVRIDSQDDEFLPTDAGTGYTIVNQMDAIIETKSAVKTVEVSTPTPKPTATPTAKPTATPTVKPNVTPTPTPRPTATPVPTATPTPNPAAKYKVTVHHYLEGTKTKVHDDDVINLAKGDKYKTSSYDSNKLSGKYKDKYVWNKKKPDNASGTMKTKNITVKYYYKIKPGTLDSNCGWHYFNSGAKITCTKKSNGGSKSCTTGPSSSSPAGTKDCPCSSCQVNTVYTNVAIWNCTGCPSTSTKVFSFSAKSALNSYSDASKAKKVCVQLADKECVSQKYDSASKTGCAGVRDWECTKSDEGKITLHDQASAPTGLRDKGYSCKCLG